MTTLSDILQSVRTRLRNAGVEDWEFESRELVEAALGLKAIDINTRQRRALDTEQIRQIVEWADRRAAGEPVAYIIGKVAFYRGEFVVRPGVLIPRVDTEVLVAEAIRLVSGKKSPKVLELGVGSGCVIVSILESVSDAQGTGSDLSHTCLQVTQDNAERQGVMRRLTLHEGSWFGALDRSRHGPFDCIVSNPPYIPRADAESLQIEVLGHEPAMALFSDNDGLEAYRTILAEAGSWLLPDGVLLFEVGYDQARRVAEIAVGQGFSRAAFVQDTQGIERVVVLRR